MAESQPRQCEIGPCFICGESMEGYTVRTITVLGALEVTACGPCVDLPDTEEFVNALIIDRLRPEPARV